MKGLKLNWISVKDKLPEDCASILVYGKDNNEEFICTAFYSNNEFEYDGDNSSCGDEITCVTHWILWDDIDSPGKDYARYCGKCNRKGIHVDSNQCIFVDWLDVFVWLCDKCAEIYFEDRYNYREKWFKDNMCKEWHEMDISKR